MIKQLNLIDKKKIWICYINKKRIFLFNLIERIYYKYLPFQFLIKKKQKSLIEIHYNLDEILLKKKFISFVSKLQQVFYVSFKILILNGLGLKAKLNIEKSLIELNLGYSHLCNLRLDKKVDIKIKKNMIILQSYDKTKLGNFACKIKSLRLPDVYKNKGIFNKTDNLKIKIIKKK